MLADSGQVRISGFEIEQEEDGDPIATESAVSLFRKAKAWQRLIVKTVSSEANARLHFQDNEPQISSVHVCIEVAVLSDS